MKELSLRERQRQVREEVILAAAHELMAEQGYADMSMDDLAARVGVSKATLYQHFASKEELAVNVVVRNMRRGEEYISSLDPQLPAIVRLEQMLRHALEGRSTFWRTRSTLPRPVLQHHQLYQAQSQRLIDAVTALVEQAKAEGSIAPQLSTPVITRMLINTIRETSYGELIGAGQCTPAELSDALVAILFDGVRTRCPAESGAGEHEAGLTTQRRGAEAQQDMTTKDAQ